MDSELIKAYVAEKTARGERVCLECGSPYITKVHFPHCSKFTGLYDPWVHWKDCDLIVSPAMYECIMSCKGIAPYTMMQIVEAVQLLTPPGNFRPMFKLAEAVVRNIWSGHVHFTTNMYGEIINVMVPGEVR